MANPIVDLRAPGNRNSALGCLLSFVIRVDIFTTIHLTPLFLGHVRGYSTWQTGVAVFPTGVAALVGTPVYIVLARRFDTRWLMMFGMACFGLAMWQFSFITSGWSGAELLIPQLLRRFPQVFAVAPSVNLGLGSLPPERLRYASSPSNMMRNLGGAIGSYPGGGITLGPNVQRHRGASHGRAVPLGTARRSNPLDRRRRASQPLLNAQGAAAQTAHPIGRDTSQRRRHHSRQDAIQRPSWRCRNPCSPPASALRPSAPILHRPAGGRLLPPCGVRRC